MQHRMALPQDEARLRSFFNEQILPGPIDLKMKRMGNYFDLYQLQNCDYQSFLLTSNTELTTEELLGSATLVYRESEFQEQKHKIAFINDMRMSEQRNAFAHWSHHFLGILEQSRNLTGCSYFFTTLSHFAGESFSSLLRPRINRHNIPRYYLLRNLQMVWVLGETLFPPKPLSSIQIRLAQETDWSKLADYIDKKIKTRPLQQLSYSADDLAFRQRTWPNFQFWIALDHNENIIGCVAPWNRSLLQQILVENYSPLTQGLQNLLYWTSLVGRTARLPREGQALNFNFLTHFFADNPDIFYTLINHCQKQCTKNEFLAYLHYDGFSLTTPPTGLFCLTMPLSFYTVLPPLEDLPQFLRHRPQQPPPVLELAFL